jgi:hypothetical protein
MKSHKNAQKLKMRNYFAEHRGDLDDTTIDTGHLVEAAFTRAGNRVLSDTEMLAICSQIIIETYQKDLRRLEKLAIKRGWLLTEDDL